MSHYEYDRPIRPVDASQKGCEALRKIEKLEILNTKLKFFLTIQTACVILALIVII